MEPATRSLVWYLLAGTRGGPNRLRILEELRAAQRNAHQLSQVLGMDYRTARHHLSLLEQHGLIFRPVGKGYASPYEISPRLAADLDTIILALSATGSTFRPRSVRVAAGVRGLAP